MVGRSFKHIIIKLTRTKWFRDNLLCQTSKYHPMDPESVFIIFSFSYIFFSSIWCIFIAFLFKFIDPFFCSLNYYCELQLIKYIHLSVFQILNFYLVCSDTFHWYSRFVFDFHLYFQLFTHCFLKCRFKCLNIF